MSSAIFRKTALDRLSSPEQLDTLMRVTSPLGWLALVTIGVTLFVVGVWSVFGAIPELVQGQCVLLRGERVYEVKAPFKGTVTKVMVTPDMSIEAGRFVMILERDKQEIQQKKALKEQQLARLAVQHAGENATDNMNIGRNLGAIGAKQKDLVALRRQRALVQDLVDRGLKAGVALLDLDRNIHSVEGEIVGLQNETAVLRTKIAPRLNEQKNLQGEITFLEGDLQRTTTSVTSPEKGRVYEVLKVVGDQVAEGESLVRLELAKREAVASTEFCGGNTHAVLYVPGQMAGRVTPQQVARVSPADVKQEEYGFILGQVAWASPYAASPDEMKEKLKNEKLVQSYNEKGPVYEARVCLTEDPTNKANGYKWSSSRGPNKRIGTGTQCVASVVVEKKRPYTYIIPTIKKAIGI